MLLGFETLNLKFRDLKLWKLTVQYSWNALGEDARPAAAQRAAAPGDRKRAKGYYTHNDILTL